MKKLTLIIVLAAFAGYTNASVPTCSTEISTHFSVNKDWVKSKSHMWLAQENTWYKLNGKDMSIWVSKDGKNWEKATNGIWKDKAGDMVKIQDMKLVWSTDGGNTWTPVPESTWEGSNGVSYKFDDHWNLWEKR